jgi:hypothetical protein
VLNYYILDFVYVLSKSFFSAVLHLNMSFKYNSGRVSITLQKKKKILSGGFPSRKKIDF